MAKRKQAAKAAPLPSKDDIIAFVKEHGGRAGKREIARAFSVRGEDRVALKEMLRELSEEGAIEKRGKKLVKHGLLPNVTVVKVTGRDQDGELVGEPSGWIEEDQGPVPQIRFAPAGRGKGRKPAPGVGDRALCRLEMITEKGRDGRAHYRARVIKALDKGAVTTLGVLRELPGGRGRVDPVDRRQLKEYTVEPEDMGEARPGDLVAIEITKQGRFGLAHARIVESHGPVGDERTVSKIAIHAHGIPDRFPPEVLKEADAARPATATGRDDLRKLPLITIDPPDARDHDDAVHAEPDTDKANPGGWIVTVAIADVAHYVTPGSAMDKEALKRGNSAYFPDQVVPMLPERISNDLCSLKPDEDRPALAVRMVFSADGQKKSHRFARVLMRSAAKLSYGQAQAAIDGNTDETSGPLLEPVLKPLWEAYGALTRGRDRREPLDLDLPERKVELKKDGSIDRIYIPPRLDAHRLIEEFMIQANVCAAETLEQRGMGLLYRVHDSPSPLKLDALREFLATLNLKLSKTGAMRPSQFNQILKKVKDGEYHEMVNQVVLRSMAQAEYTPENIGHFGLNLRRYAHFTSPIRRYADLIVHRGLIRALKLGPDGLRDETIAELEEIGAQISAAERRAMAAERDTLDRLVAMHLSRQVGARFAARISGVTRFGLFITLAETGADGFIPARSLEGDYYRYDERRQAMIGDATGEMHRIGDDVEVKLVEAVPLAGALRFELLSEGRFVKERAPRERNSRRPPPRGRGGKKKGRR